MAITDSLMAYFKLDEASGDALDAHGSNNLTDTNTVQAASGIISGARDFERDNGELFTLADNADLSTGDIDWTIQAWVIAETLSAGANWIVSKRNAAGTAVEYQLFYRSTSRFALQVFDGAGTNRGTVQSDVLGAPSTATPYHIVCGHDSVNNLVFMYVNGVAQTPVATSGAGGDSTSVFNIGAGGDSAGFCWDGLIDEVGFWKRVLTSGEVASLYNAGAGLAYPFAAGGAVIPVFMNQYRQRVA